ncbi:MAG: HAD family hydrolase [Candidatus Asgardarchaeia archaeon]
MGIKCVLFDLDLTLIDSKIGRKIRDAILKSYVRYLHERTGLDVERIAKACLKVTYSLKERPPKDSTIYEAYLDGLSSILRLRREEVDSFTKEYYEHAFDELREYYIPIENSRKVLEEIIGMGLKVGIATDPIIRRVGVLKRLEWGNLSGLPYCFVSNADECHAAKPHPMFYREVLGKCGVRAEETVMVGDSYGNDVVGARKVGIETVMILKYESIEFNAGLPDFLVSDIFEIPDLVRSLL